ncbi:MAG: hypothetical protein AAGJ81_15790 [Verrucomicrobiota bacterium]
MKLLSKPKEKLGLFVFALLIIVFILTSYSIYRSVAIPWPRISNPEDLVHDCEILLRSYPKGFDLPRNSWPKSVSDLDPQYVFVDDGYVKIVLSGGGIGDSWGLIVAGEDGQIIMTEDTEKTRNNRIYRFE